MNFFRFLFSKAFLICIVIAGVICVGGFYLLMNFLTDYTRHGQKVAVPNVIGENISEMDVLLVEKGFRYEVIDSIFDRRKKKGEVVDQKPNGEDFVKEGRNIYVTIVARSNEVLTLSLSEILGRTQRIAIRNLCHALGPKGGVNRHNIKAIERELIDSIEYKPYKYDDFVLEVKTKKGKILKDNDKVVAGTKVILVVGTTKGLDKVKVPNLLKLNLNRGYNELVASQLNVTVSEIGDRSCFDVKDSSSAIIVKQIPLAGEEIKIGSEVSLFYSCDTLYFKK